MNYNLFLQKFGFKETESSPIQKVFSTEAKTDNLADKSDYV